MAKTHWDQRYMGKPVWDRDLPSPLLTHSINTQLIKPCRVLSIGCGSGTNEIYLAQLGFEVVGVDISSVGLGIANKKAVDAGVNIKFVCMDVLNNDLNLRDFDLVFDRGCYHHLRYYCCNKYVNFVRRVLKVGGQCFIISCNADSPPGIREKDMRTDFKDGFVITQLKMIDSMDMDGSMRKRSEWLLLMDKK